MVIEVRKTLVWGTAACAVLSAALLASSGGGPRVAGLVSDAVRGGRPLAAAKADSPTSPGSPGTASAAPAGPSH